MGSQMTTESTSAASPWVVLKFGGTSVSSVTNWKNIAGVLRDRLSDGLRPVVVHSALSGITDRLEQLLSLALGNEWQPVMDQIERSEEHTSELQSLRHLVCRLLLEKKKKKKKKHKKNNNKEYQYMRICIIPKE